MVLKYLKSWLTKGNIGLQVKMPSLVIVDNLEEAIRLQRTSNPKKKLIIHSPRIISENSSISKNFGNYKRIKIRRGLVRRSMAKLYKKSSELQEDTEKALASLEDRIEAAAEKRDQETEKLTEAAKSLSQDKNTVQTDNQVNDLIGRLLTMQFEHPEHFIREAIQNADGSWEDKKENRIDVYLDSKNKTAKVEDNGKGMTPKEIDKYFFTVFASQNQELDYAAGKFGIGAVSFFGLGHESVIVDSKPRKGEGGRVTIDESLARPPEISGTTRITPGTTIEIKLKDNSEVDFKKVLRILKEDCCYIETPLFIHKGRATKKLNKPLDPKNSSTTISFKEKRVEGFLKKAGSGKLDLLDHRIRLSSIPTKGYSGAVNCSQLDTTFSRDSTVQDPVLKQVLAIVDEKRKILEIGGEINKKQLSLDARVAKYRSFVKNNFFDGEGMPNERWIRENFSTFKREKKFMPYVPYIITGSSFGLLAGMSPALLAMAACSTPPLAAAAGALAGGIWLSEKAFPGKKWSLAEKIAGFAAGVALGGGVLFSSALGELYCWQALVSEETTRGITALIKEYTKIGLSICLPLGTALGTLIDAHHYTYKGLVNSKYKKLENIAANASSATLPKYKRSIFNYIPVINDIYRYIKLHVPSIGSIGKKIAKTAKYGILTAGLVVGVSTIGYGTCTSVKQMLPENMFDNLRTAAPGGHYDSRENLARFLNLRRVCPGNDSCSQGCGEGTTSTKRTFSKSKFNSLSKISKMPLWSNEIPVDELAIHAWEDIKLPEEIAKKLTPDSSLEDKLAAIEKHMIETYEYDAIPELAKYDDVIEAMLAEKKAVCDSANTYAALLLNELDVKRVHYVTGDFHAWLEVDHGTKEAPDWQAFDMTPQRMNPELSKLLGKKSPDPIKIPLQPLLMALLGVAGITFYKRTKAKRRIWKEYNGELSDTDQHKLDDIREAMQCIPDEVSVIYGKNLDKDDSRFYMSRSRIVLNMKKDHDPQMIALGYAAHVLKDEKLTRSIAKSYREDI